MSETRRASRSLWRHADFMKLWSAETVSQLGTQITFLALPLTAIIIMRATPFQVGLLGTLEYLPFILVGLPAGVWVDRLRRRPILIVGDLGRAALLGSIPVAYALDALTIWHLYVVAFLTGICTVFFDVAYQSYLPSLVHRDQIVDGNAKLEASRSGAHLAGPGLAGVLVEALRAPMAIAFDALSFLWSAGFVFWIRKHEPPVAPHPDGIKPSMRREIGEGLRYVLGHRLLRPIAACTATSNFFNGGMLTAVVVLFAVRELDLSPGQIGLAFGIGNAGFLAGAVTARRVADRVGVGPAIVGSAMLFGSAPFLLPLATPSTAMAMFIGMGIVVGFGGAVYNINQVSLRQAITAERMQGRMNATMRFVVWGTIPIGSFVGGILGGAVGLRPTLWVVAIGGFFAFVPPLLSPVRKLERIPEPEEQAPPRPGAAPSVPIG
jgi:MFS family permease